MKTGKFIKIFCIVLFILLIPGGILVIHKAFQPLKMEYFPHFEDNLRKQMDNFKNDLANLSKDPPNAVKEILKQPKQNQWILFYHFGQDIGDMYGIEFDNIKKVADLIPEKFWWDYYDGVGDGVDWPKTGKTPVELIQLIRQNIKNQEFQNNLIIGVILRFVIYYEADLDKIFYLLKSVESETDLKEREVGVSVGLMRVFMNFPLEAVPYIIDLQKEYQETCFEELGWWIGEHNQGDISGGIKELTEVPSDYRCSAYHGWVRGVEVFNSISEFAEKILKFVPEKYQECSCSALGWKVSRRFLDNENEITEELNSIKDTKCRQFALREIKKLN